MSSPSDNNNNNQNETRMWKSKLGTKYPMDFMKANEKQFHQQLQSLRQIPANRDCADCGAKGCTMWASVNLGVFLCITCGSHHRSLGTHITKPKGCTGTYWWGPDELETMKTIGNARARQLYGGFDTIPEGVTPNQPMKWRQYLTDKYVHKKYATATGAIIHNNDASRQVVSRNSRVVRNVDDSLPSLLVKEQDATIHDLMSFGGDQQPPQGGGKNNHLDDFFSNFGESSNPTTQRTNMDVDLLLGLNNNNRNTKTQKKEKMEASKSQTTSPPTTMKKENIEIILNNHDFFAEFGL